MSLTDYHFEWMDKDSRFFISSGYLQPGETPESRARHIGQTVEDIIAEPGYAKAFMEVAEMNAFSMASPFWSNMGRPNGLPISCNGSYFPDTMHGILDKTTEVGMMTKYGAGTSGLFSDIRSRGAPITGGWNADGPVHFMGFPQTAVELTAQGPVRRGAFAAYLSIDSPDIKEFLKIRSEGHPIQHLSFGVVIPDLWWHQMKNERHEDKLEIWARVLQKRRETGYPYIIFEGNMNRGAADVYRDKGLRIRMSNLCTEIALPVSEDESFVCDLSSMNFATYDDWKDTKAVQILVKLLDAGMTEYIRKTEGIKGLEAPNRFAKRHRALGVGTLGLHTYLQNKGIAFEDPRAGAIDESVHKEIRNHALEASKELAKRFGEPELLTGYGRRNTTLMAIAPTTSSSFIHGKVSPSIELHNSNYYVKDLAKGKFSFRNPALEKLLEKKGLNNESVWRDILRRGGSVQHIEQLDTYEKSIFKTASETSQRLVVERAAARQRYIDQAQSLNLYIHPDTPPKDVNQLIIYGEEAGIKSFYYQRSTNPAQELARDLNSCVACEA